MSKDFLLVDDSRVARMVLKRTLLEIAPDCTFEEAGNGEEALTALQNGEFDMAFLDFHMPGMNGLELLEENRSNTENINVDR
jgi:CheY-like chemotaxis protein